jgi:hypothetical protein
MKSKLEVTFREHDLIYMALGTMISEFENQIDMGTEKEQMLKNAIKELEQLKEKIGYATNY